MAETLTPRNGRKRVLPGKAVDRGPAAPTEFVGTHYAAEQAPLSDAEQSPAASRPPMHPGEYFRLRRRHAGLTRRRLADLLHSDPATADDFLHRLRHLEDTGEFIGDSHAITHALRPLIRIDRHAIAALAALREDPTNPDLPVPAICRTCGCTFHIACIDPVTGSACRWVAPDLCSNCAPAGEGVVA